MCIRAGDTNPIAHPPRAALISADEFRQGMRRLAASVCVLTSECAGQVVGLTATAVTSLSADPPRLLACVNKKVFAHSAIEQSKKLCINVLSTDEVSIAQSFGGMKPDIAAVDRFSCGAWQLRQEEAPVLQGALVSFRCSVAEMISAHTHSILICDVLGVVLGEASAAPLIYVNGRFSSVATEI
ncbi:MAG: flavin reductase family protein [Pseudomonadota bacterium]